MVRLARLSHFLPLREDNRAGFQTHRNLGFARNPKVSRFDQITLLSEAHNSGGETLYLSFGNKPEPLLPADQGYDQEACSRMDGEGSPNGDDEDEQNQSAKRTTVSDGSGNPTPAGNGTAKRLRMIQ